LKTSSIGFARLLLVEQIVFELGLALLKTSSTGFGGDSTAFHIESVNTLRDLYKYLLLSLSSATLAAPHIHC
jgi:hypothetical protein